MAMQGSVTQTLSRRWDDYRPTKSTLAWACAGAAVATMIVGFTWGGWMTGKSARELASVAGATARGDLAGSICVERFNAAADATARLAELKAISGAFAQRQFVEKGGWATMPGETAPDRRGAETCAIALVA
jgi:hypothetical protein